MHTSKTTPKATIKPKGKALPKSSVKNCCKALNELALGFRTTRLAIRTALSQPPQDLEKIPGGASWFDLQHEVEAFAIESNKTTIGIISSFQDFTGDLYTFLSERNTSFDAKSKELDEYVSHLAELAGETRKNSLQTSNKLDSLQALLSAVTPLRKSLFTRVLEWFRSIFASGRRSLIQAPQSKCNNHLNQEARKRDAAIKATDKLLKKLRSVDFTDVIDMFSQEVDKARRASRQCQTSKPTQTGDNRLLFYSTLAATHKNTLELLNAVRGYKNALEDSSPVRR